MCILTWSQCGKHSPLFDVQSLTVTQLTRIIALWGMDAGSQWTAAASLRVGPPIDLLIRRSLVRAQVGEPINARVSRLAPADFFAFWVVPVPVWCQLSAGWAGTARHVQRCTGTAHADGGRRIRSRHKPHPLARSTRSKPLQGNRALIYIERAGLRDACARCKKSEASLKGGAHAAHLPRRRQLQQPYPCGAMTWRQTHDLNADAAPSAASAE